MVTTPATVESVDNPLGSCLTSSVVLPSAQTGDQSPVVTVRGMPTTVDYIKIRLPVEQGKNELVTLKLLTFLKRILCSSFVVSGLPLTPD